MVKKRLKILISILTPVFLSVAAMMWILGTDTGATWLIGQLPHVETAEIRGRIAGTLEIEDLKVESAGSQVRLHRVEWTMHPGRLLAGALHWSDISLNEMEVQLPESSIEKTDKSFTLPDPQYIRKVLPGWLGWIDIHVGTLKIEDMAVRREGQDIFSLENLEAAADWSDGQLTLKLDKLETGLGSGEADFSLQAETLEGSFQLKARLAEEWKGLKQVETHWRFSPTGKERARGNGVLDLAGGDGLLARIDAQLVFSSRRLDVEHLVASRPDRPGELEMNGKLIWSEGASIWDGQIFLRDVELAEWNIPLRLDGKVKLKGRPQAYEGRFAMTGLNPGWQLDSLAGAFSGNQNGIALTDIQGELLQGPLSGTAEIDWLPNFHSVVDLKLREIDMNHFMPAVDSSLNGDLSGSWEMLGDNSKWSMNLDLLPSEWQSNRVSGELAADGSLKRIDLESLHVRGDGLDLKASGPLAEKVEFDLQVARLSNWWPKAEGKLGTGGWLKWKPGSFATSFQGELQELRMYGASFEKTAISGKMDGWLQNIELSVSGSRLTYRDKSIDRFDLGLRGSLQQHQGKLVMDWISGEMVSNLSGGWQNNTWKGLIENLRLSEQDVGSLTLLRPVELEAGRLIFHLSPMQLESDRNESLQVESDISLDPFSGSVRLSWGDLKLERLNPWLPVQMKGTGSGESEISLDAGRLASARVDAEFGLNLEWQELELSDTEIRIAGDWGKDGLKLTKTTQFSEGGELRLNVTSPSAPGWNVPARGKVHFDWVGLPLKHARIWLPLNMSTTGTWEGEAVGTWQERDRFALDWSSQIEQGTLSWRDQGGTLTASNLAGYLDGNWRNDTLVVDTGLDLSRQGRLVADIGLPLSNRFPFEFDNRTSWTGYFELTARESGLLSYVLPGMVEKTDGEINIFCDLAGTPSDPSFSGRLALTEASGTIPALGVRLEQIELQVALDNDEIDIEKLLLVSGDGNLQGEGRFRLEGWELAEQRWNVRGNAMPLLRLPELELFATPDLEGEGTADTLEVRGDVLVPRMRLSSINAPGQMPVGASSDVVVVEKAKAAERVSPFRLDARIRLELGKEVVVDTAGIDARLSGDVTLDIDNLEQVSANGQIKVEQGTYSGYGLRLPIQRGLVFFAGGPIQRPTLDVLAYKTIDEVKAGVKITGTPRQPVVELYSEPAMPDTDILSYLVLGRPLDEEGGQTDALMLAAAALLSQGESAALQDTLQRRLGLDVIQVNSGEGDVSESVVTIGKYLEPNLYVSLGYSVFSQTNELKLRYNLSEHWELQSNMGEESGADIYYRFDFD